MATSRATTSQPELVNRVSVLLPLPLSGAFDYGVPSGMTVAVGDYVIVPLGNRQVNGVVWGASKDDVDSKKIKDITGLLDVPHMPDALRRFVDWVASYTLTLPGQVLRMTMSVPSALDAPRTITAYRVAPGALTDQTDSRIRMTAARRRVLDILTDKPPHPAAKIAKDAGVSPSVVRSMADAGLLSPVSLIQRADLPEPDWRSPGPRLSPAQADAAAALVDSVERSAAKPEDGFAVKLLDGVTGSGKTEVYFEAVVAALAADRQVLVLLPEIALTAQWLKRFSARFGAPPFEWHSDLTGAERRYGWRAIAAGEAKVVVGARSALFLPFPALGLIIVDEEHDSSFKQEEGVIYNARDMAVVRARMGEFPVILSSATPSLETVINTETGRYDRLQLPERHAGAALPAIGIVDMRSEALDRQSWVSPTLQQAVTETLADNEQVMLFLNRRGYAPLTLCRTCGHRLECPNCTAWLVEHRLEGRLECHHCGLSISPPETCPECGAVESFAACGPGVERLAEEVALRFPNARCDIMASDTIQSPAAAAALVQRMQDRAIDILIGTQIMAKGHHFPYLTLVGVIDADLGLAGGDLRAAERTYQILHQVAGRAGREDRPGRVLLQSYRPDHAVMEALVSGDRDRFMTAEAAERERHHMPPFGRLAALIVSGPDMGAVDGTARALARSRPTQTGLHVLGPAPAPLAILRGRHRRRLLVKGTRDINMQAVLRHWLAHVRVPGGVRVQVDIDPYSFL
ncbi:MAG: primosomal protein N' [Rhodospirillaceae bacterium]|jgi:primosomal protein N' (replication factor Y) (superfamily II helicase)|nr:primosomal protein N' [Rhodospirillaceae bacterium]MBT5458483.1 primosomal protein N' [Rhodospirillaceae bacterium]